MPSRKIYLCPAIRPITNKRKRPNEGDQSIHTYNQDVNYQPQLRSLEENVLKIRRSMDSVMKFSAEKMPIGTVTKIEE